MGELRISYIMFVLVSIEEVNSPQDLEIGGAGS